MMKNILYSVVTLVVISATIPQANIIGKWMFVEDTEVATVYFEFNEDSTFQYLAVFEEPFVTDTIQFEGRYSLKENTLVITPHEIASENYTVLRLEGDTMELKYKKHQYFLIRK